MPIDSTEGDYLTGYSEAREKYSRKFLHMFDQLVNEFTPGVGTALTIIFFPPVGLLTSWVYNNSRKELYNNLITIANDVPRLKLIDQDSCINALKNKGINLNDVTRMSIPLLNFIVKPKVLNFIQRDAEAVKQHNKRNTRLNKERNSGLNRLETVMEKFRKDKYSDEALVTLFQPILQIERTKLTEVLNVIPRDAKAVKQQNERNKGPKETFKNKNNSDTDESLVNRFQPMLQIERQKLTEEGNYLTALSALRNTLPLIKNDKILTKTVEIINQVQRLKRQGHSKAELTEALSNTHFLLYGRIEAEDFRNFAKQTQGSPSTGMKLLGAVLIALGALAAAAGIIIATTGVGIGTGVGVAAAGTSVGIVGATFFSHQGLSKAMSSLDKTKTKDWEFTLTPTEGEDGLKLT